jgi:phosphoglycolate phosphatase-like HAD superfamily hydrolase
MAIKNFGICSGSTLNSAKYALGDILSWFNPETQIFLDYIKKAEQGKEVDSNLNLKKPNPFSLFKATEKLNQFNFVLYIGDSLEDVIMFQKAKKLDPRFLFAGVYSYSHFNNEIIHDFLKYECDLILPSVENLPYILNQLREKNENWRNI